MNGLWIRDCSTTDMKHVWPILYIPRSPSARHGTGEELDARILLSTSDRKVECERLRPRRSLISSNVGSWTMSAHKRQYNCPVKDSAPILYVSDGVSCLDHVSTNRIRDSCHAHLLCPSSQHWDTASRAKLDVCCSHSCPRQRT